MTAATCSSFTDADAQKAELVAMLAVRGADALPHPGGTLLAHLQRTAHKLAAWGASRELVVAGLCHAAYGTQGFPTPLFRVADREELRARIGDEAEAIVYAYCALDRAYQHDREPNDANAHGRTRHGEMRDRFSGEYWLPPDRLRRQLAELTVANELDVAEHAELSSPGLLGIAAMISAAGPWVSQAAWSAARGADRLQDGLSAGAAPSGDVDLAFRELGSGGPQVVLWHGGADPAHTWSRQHALASTFALRIPWRRGFAPSVSAARQDWADDTLDLLRVMPDRAHVVAHSYGGVSALIAASIAPHRFASLVVLEAPVAWVDPDDAEVQQIASLARAFANGAPEARAAFLALAALPEGHPQTARLERLARNVRDPSEARFELTQLRASGLRIAVASGAHNAAIERMSDVLSRELGAERWVLPGAAHAVARQADFNDRLRAFVGGDRE